MTSEGRENTIKDDNYTNNNNHGFNGYEIKLQILGQPPNQQDGFGVDLTHS